jgi:ADP-heptose:LPS heptosyltransferase
MCTDFEFLSNVRKAIEKKESMVIYRNVGGIGDAVMIVPAITALRKEFGNRIKIVIVTLPYCAPVFFNNPDIDFVVDGNQFASIEMCREYFEKLGSLFIALSNPCPSAMYEASNEPEIHKSRQQLFCEACGVKYKIENNKLFVSEEDNTIARQAIKLDRYVVVHCSSNSKFRDLPHYHTDFLIKKLSEKLKPEGIGVVLISHNWKYKHHKRDNIVRVLQPPLRHTIAVINNSMGLIGADSMGVHVAGALGLPTYGLFGMTNPNMRMLYPVSSWYKGYNRCHRQYCWYHPCAFRFCLKAISMEKVSEDFINFIFTKGREI